MKISEKERKRIKFQTVVIPIASLIIGIIVFAMVFYLMHTSEAKTPVSSGEAFVMLQMKGYEPTDTKDSYLEQFADLNGSFELKTNDTDLLYFDTLTRDSADKIYGYFTSEITNFRSHSEGYKNYRFYDSHADDEYKIVIQVDGTVLYCKTTKEHTKEIQEYIVELGYWDKTEI